MSLRGIKKEYGRSIFRNHGFTLIEIIVVMVIVGVLAAIALPSFYTWIERSKSAEAILTARLIKDNIEPQFQKNVGINVCPATGMSPPNIAILPIIDSIPQSKYFLHGTADAVALSIPPDWTALCIEGVLWISVDRNRAVNFSGTDPCDGFACTMRGCGAPAQVNNSSGITLCRSNSGAYEIIGVGIYAGVV